MDNKFLLKILFLMILVFSSAHISLSMDRYRTGFKINEDQRIVIRMIESHLRNQEKQSRKLLEHACFKGESLLFQNEFFSSNYAVLPPRQAKINYIILKEESDLNATFAYHQHYRKICFAALNAVECYVDLMDPDRKTSIKLNGFAFDMLISGRHGFLLENMKQAWSSYDYPQMLLILEEVASSKYL